MKWRMMGATQVVELIIVVSMPHITMGQKGSGGSPAPVQICTDAPSCATSDGHCDDGGPGSEYNYCNLGTDCIDCGPRMILCANTCVDSSDGDCDDGGSGSEYNYCSFGTDCIDCGARTARPSPPRCQRAHRGHPPPQTAPVPT
jgi:hypothetical protein